MAPDSPIREPDQIRQDAARKLRTVQVSEHFQAIVGCLLNEKWTTPRLIEMVDYAGRPRTRSLRGRRFVSSFPGSVGRSAA